MTPAFTGFPDEAITFYEGLEADNSKPYWNDRKPIYERSVQAPMQALLAALEPEFGEPHFFRPYRDVRFSKDKSPYKTLTAGREWPPEEWLSSAECLDVVAGAWRAMAPLNGWLETNVGATTLPMDRRR